MEERRGTYENIRKTLLYLLLAGNTGELLLMTICVVTGLPSLLLPIHLLWINLATDGLPLCALQLILPILMSCGSDHGIETSASQMPRSLAQWC